MSADERLGLVYAPTGNATPDYYGGKRRPFDDKYSSSVVALDADTGRLRWSFQTVHHDLWDYDMASQPTVVDFPGPAGTIHALLAPTKRGEIFMLDRATGKPLSRVEEQTVPGPNGPSIVGERYAPTQPFSVGLPSFRPADLREQDMWGLTPLDQLWCRLRFREARYEGAMTPIGFQPSIVYPGYLGGMDWGGVSIDKVHGVAVVNSSLIANYNRIVSRAEADRRGVVRLGHSGGKVVDLGGTAPQENTPYAAGVQPFLSPLGAPCNKPPYGKLSAIDLRTHKLLWSRPVGTARDSGPFGLSTGLPIPMGIPMSGGTVTTAGGLIFMGSTAEATFRAMDLKTGKELWSARLPAGGQATPMTYLSPASRRQFVVIAAGGNVALRSRLGSKIVAYSLPR
jgi:quinoprotein glucose dehydrogenase